MLFGLGSRIQPPKRSGPLGGSLRGAALANVGMLALRWWRNRRFSATSRAGRDGDRNPVHGWQ